MQSFDPLPHWPKRLRRRSGIASCFGQAQCWPTVDQTETRADEHHAKDTLALSMKWLKFKKDGEKMALNTSGKLYAVIIYVADGGFPIVLRRQKYAETFKTITALTESIAGNWSTSSIRSIGQAVLIIAEQYVAAAHISRFVIFDEEDMEKPESQRTGVVGFNLNDVR